MTELRRIAAVLIAALVVWWEGRLILDFLDAASSGPGEGEMSSSQASSGLMILLLGVALLAAVAGLAYVHVRCLWDDPQQDSSRRRVARWMIIALDIEHLLLLTGMLLFAGSMSNLLSGMYGEVNDGMTGSLWLTFLKYGAPHAVAICLLWPSAAPARRPAVRARPTAPWEHPAQSAGFAPPASGPAPAPARTPASATRAGSASGFGSPLGSAAELFAAHPQISSFTMTLRRQDTQVGLSVVEVNGMPAQASSADVQHVVRWASTHPPDLLALLGGGAQAARVLIRASGVRLLPVG